MAFQDLTVQNIIDDVSQDIRKVLATSGSDQAILIDFVHRVHLAMVRHSEWPWMLSPPKRFITKLGQSDYFIGSGTVTVGSVNTSLGISDLHWIKGDSVFNRSMMDSGPYPIFHTDTPPNRETFFFHDFQARQGIPKMWYHPEDNRNLISLYPAPDNQNTYQPSPNPPNCETTVSGALAARTYYIKITFVDSAGGESAASTPSTRVFVPASSLVKVKSPSLPLQGMSSGITYNQYKVYASTTQNSEQLQSSAINFGTDWTEPGGGLIAGVGFPTNSTIESMYGYIIEFRYYKLPITLTAVADVLQVPTPYKDIIVAGVNAMAFQYLQKAQEAAAWYGLWQSGMKQMSTDKYPFGTDFVRPGRNP